MRNPNLPTRFAMCLVTICLLLSIISYLLDCVFNLPYALKNFNILGLYLMDYLLFHSWIFAICIVCYYFLFKILGSYGNLVLKCMVSLLTGLLLSRWLLKDDYSLIISELKPLKITLAYCLTSVSAVLFMETAAADRLLLKLNRR